MTRRTRLSMKLRGADVIVDLIIYGPERDVGIMSPWFEDEVIYDETGTHELDWELDDDDYYSIGERVNDYYYSER